jgi:cyclic pyranopterin phosphate synthase
VAIKGFNDDEALDFARLAQEQPFQVRFIELMPVGKTTLDYGEDYMPGAQLIKIIRQRYALDPLKNKINRSDGPAKILRLKVDGEKIGFINPVSDHFCSTCAIAWVV